VIFIFSSEIMKDSVTRLFGIKFPVVQAGMVWCSGWKLASAVSNAGGLGLIGSGSMRPELLEEHILKCREATDYPFGVNVPLLYPEVEKTIEKIIQHRVPVVFTSAGSPAKWTSYLKQHGITVVHVVASVKNALKCVEAGVDAIVAEGFEAGGHDGKDETTSMTLIPLVRREVSLPLIAAGGIATGRAMAAAFVLGADGVQIGSRFAASEESSAHPSFKQKIIDAKEGETMLTMKSVIPVRILKNSFFGKIQEMEASGASPESIREFLGKGRSRKGMFEGDLEHGELEIGQVSALIDKIRPAAEIIGEIMKEFEEARKEMCTW
jgi:enoyl-[acyl-carrier protein] reductase II